MKHRPIHWLLVLLVLVGLALALRQDLANLALRQGNTHLRDGDATAAQAAYARAITLGQPAAPLAYNLGVSLYRKGDYPQAQAQFTAALAAAGPELAVAGYYNRGNSRFRQAERLVADDPAAARRSFQEAAADYAQALALAPGAADAHGNLGLARARLAGLENEAAPPERKRAAGADPAQKAEAGGGPKARTRQERPAAGQAAAGDAGKETARADAAASSGKTRRALSRQEAERLLNEARGRERPAGTPLHGRQDGQLAQPERDW